MANARPTMIALFMTGLQFVVNYRPLNAAIGMITLGNQVCLMLMADEQESLRAKYFMGYKTNKGPIPSTHRH